VVEGGDAGWRRGAGRGMNEVEGGREERWERCLSGLSFGVPKGGGKSAEN